MVRIIEVGPRDGLQNEAASIPTTSKLAFVRALLESGLREIEVTSFVSPKWVPQLGDAAELWPPLAELAREFGPRSVPVPPSDPAVKSWESEGGETPALADEPLFSALIPNAKGLERALEVGVRRIAVFTAASDSFTRKNINMTIDESLAVFQDVIAAFRSVEPNGWVRGYVSTAFECPLEGRVLPSETVRVASRLAALGCDEISIGDTLGVAAPTEVRALTRLLVSHIPKPQLAYHFHDTRGTAIANVAEALEQGIMAFDSSAGGLGGCPYAPGAGGNVATEDVVYFLERTGVPTGIDLRTLAQASLPILEQLGRPVSAKAQRAVLSA
ncbi:MAG TPA: hydroxymethylglutaryl-CoA lyase [Fimbriimonadaceae bacterium]|nr:hydroxymethylglutaryl-CoA lyase [Fimbriimonadaceae bacterium]